MYLRYPQDIDKTTYINFNTVTQDPQMSQCVYIQKVFIIQIKV